MDFTQLLLGSLSLFAFALISHFLQVFEVLQKGHCWRPRKQAAFLLVSFVGQAISQKGTPVALFTEGKARSTLQQDLADKFMGMS